MRPLRFLKLAVLSLFAGTTLFVAQLAAAHMHMDKETLLNPDQMKWMDGPPGLPAGGKMTVLAGDPSKPGIFTVRFMAPAGYTIPPHWHSRPENLTVISGVICFGYGDKLDLSHAHAVVAGGFHHVPAAVHHFAFAKGPSVIQVQGEGPFDIIYVNPSDDPRTK